jgi:hypothetical protein
VNGPSLSRRSLLRGGAVAGVAALAGCTAVGVSALPSPDGAAYSDVAHVRETHRDAAVGHLRSLLDRGAPVVERAAAAGVFDDRRLSVDPGYLDSAREFLDGRTSPTVDTVNEVRHHVAYVAETVGAAAAGLDDVRVGGDDSPANVGPAPGIDDLRGSIRYAGDDPATALSWVELVESWLHASVVAGGNAGVDRDELAELDEAVRERALARAVRNHERAVRFLSDARQFYRTFRSALADPTSLGLDSAREAYRERTAAAARDHEWYRARRVDDDASPPPRATALNRVLTLRPGENSLDDADWARRDGLRGLETVRLAEAAAEFAGFDTGRAAAERVAGESSVPGGLLFETKRRAVQRAYRIASTGDRFERCLLRRATLYLSKGDRFLAEEDGIADHHPRAHALACYGVAGGVADAIPSVASVVTD